MPVPLKMSDLATLAASNSPAGSDAIGNSLDDYIRAVQAIIRSTNALSSASIAAASTVDLGTADGESVIVTGSATITSFGTTASGIKREVVFTSAGSVLTNSSSIVLPNAANITVVAGDIFQFRSQGSGNWKMVGTRSQLTISDVNGLTAALAALQPSLGFTPVNKAGDSGVGALSLTGNLTTTGSVTVGSVFAASGTSVVVGTNAAGTVFLRPNGSASTTGQSTVASDGHLSVSGIADVVQPLTTMQTASGTPGFAINATTNAFSSCYMQFNRVGSFYCYFGVDQNNSLAVGGGSFGATSFRVLHEGLSSPTLTSLTLGGGRILSKITLSNSAPGALATGELYLQF